ncbi:MAG: ATP-binding protein [Rhodocyclaceae bacterium]|nr:ATP-binding protein [Rhodocyclaceae bacterium]
MHPSLASPSFSARRLWIAVGAFLLLLWGGIAGGLGLVARTQESNARQDAARLAQALALQTGQFLQSIETTLGILERRIDPAQLTPSVAAGILDEMRGHMPEYLDFGIFDRDGRGVAATVRGFKVGASFADRDYFRAQREEPDRGTYLGAPIVGRTAGAQVLPLSLALKDNEGRFAGVLMAAIYMRHLAELFERFPLGEKGLIVLLRREPLQIVARAPGQADWFARNVETAPAFAGIVRGEKSGFVSAEAADGIPRLIAWQNLERYPLAVAVAVGFALDDLDAATANERRALVGGGLIATLLALVAGFALSRAQARTHEAFLVQQNLVELRERDARQLAEIADTLNRAQRVAHIGSWHLDLAHNKLDWSAETYRIFGVTDGHPLSYEDFLACVHPDDRERVDAAWQAALQGAPYDIVHRIVVDGETKWVREQAELKFDAQGQLIAGIRTVQDVTREQLDQIALEESRAAAEAANEAKSEFLANMSHEIRTPMNAILGLTQLALDGPLEDGQRELLANALASGRALLSILNDILDYSKIEAGRMEIARLPFSPAAVLKETGDLFTAQIKEKSLSLDIEIDPAIPAQVIGDPLRLGQVLANLVGNAVKFTERGGIALHAELAAERPEGLMLRFAVRDTGIGLDRTTAERLFQPFTQADGSITRRHGGTGLGLAISKKLVALMGGEIGVTSQPGQGATFSFTVVVERADGAAPAVSSIAAQ